MMFIIHDPQRLKQQLRAARKKLLELNMEQLRTLLSDTMEFNRGVHEAQPWIDMILMEIDSRHMNESAPMSLDRFFDFLNLHYCDPIDGTHIVVKFYAQVGTFSYELHDQRQDCFHDESRVYRSKVHYGWLDERVRRNILNEVIREARRNHSALASV